MTYTLYDYHRSSTAYRVRIALNWKGVSYATVPVSLLAGDQRSDAHRARNPMGAVPVLDTGERMLTQSLAILDWLDARHPDPPLLPADPDARADTLARAHLIAMDIHPLDNLRVLHWLKDELGVDKPARDRWYAHWVHEGFAALEALAGDGRYLGGERPDLSDVCLLPQMYNARRFDVDVAAYPRLVAVAAALDELEPWAAAHPDRVAPD